MTSDLDHTSEISKATLINLIKPPVLQCGFFFGIATSVGFGHPGGPRKLPLAEGECSCQSFHLPGGPRLSAAAVPMIRVVKAQARPRNIVISSSNGVPACAKAMSIIKAGGDTLDAVIAGVNIQELDPNDTSVGYGGLPNEDGIVELDASCIHGPTRRGGAVGALRNIKTPSKVAQKVLTDTDHMMLVGEGALRFARAM